MQSVIEVLAAVIVKFAPPGIKATAEGALAVANVVYKIPGTGITLHFPDRVAR